MLSSAAGMKSISHATALLQLLYHWPTGGDDDDDGYNNNI
jgi:hypothetical protein